MNHTGISWLLETDAASQEPLLQLQQHKNGMESNQGPIERIVSSWRRDG
jgi:hypothetical protein